MSKKEIVNDLTEGATKAVQLQDGKFVTESLYYQHKAQVLKMYLSWHDIKRIVEIADSLMPYVCVKQGDLEHNFQSEEDYYREVLKRYNENN